MMDGTLRHSTSASTTEYNGRKASSMQKSISGGIFDQLGSSSAADDAHISDQMEAQRRQEFIDIWRQLRIQYPHHDMHTLNDMAAVEMMNRVPKSRGRIQSVLPLAHSFALQPTTVYKPRSDWVAERT